MKHINDVEVSLETAKGTTVVEVANPHAPNPVKYRGLVGSRLISVKGGSGFIIRVTVGDDFKIYTAKGVKIAVVATFRRFNTGEIVKCSQAWWIDVKATDPQTNITLSCFADENGSNGKRKNAPFVFPQPAGDFATAPQDWFLQEAYCANEGCIAVFVERGKLDIQRMRASGVKVNDWQTLKRKTREPLPIAFDWFNCLRSDHGYPYVFEFRNMDRNQIDFSQNVAAPDFGYEVEDFCASESSDGSSSFNEESSDQDMSDASINEISEASESELDDSDESISPRKRKRPTTRLQHSHKIRRTTFVASNKPPNAKGTSTVEKPGCPQECPLDECCDSDDEEVVPPSRRRHFKQESSIKSERPAGTGAKAGGSSSSLASVRKKSAANAVMPTVAASSRYHKR